MVLLLDDRPVMPEVSRVFCILVTGKLVYNVFGQRAEKQQQSKP